MEPGPLEDDLLISIEVAEDGSEICFVVRSQSGRAIEQNEFILELERYLFEVTSSITQIKESDSSLH